LSSCRKGIISSVTAVSSAVMGLEFVPYQIIPMKRANTRNALIFSLEELVFLSWDYLSLLVEGYYK